jgi:hypothetical protein
MELAEVLRNMGDIADKEILAEWEAQGHPLTGTWEDSLRSEVDGDSATAMALTYGVVVNEGVTPENIPDQGTAEFNRYIADLAEYFKLRMVGISNTQAARLAFLTWRKHKQEGMSTAASRRFSQTGERQHFIEAAMDRAQPLLDDVLCAGADAVIDSNDLKEMIL